MTQTYEWPIFPEAEFAVIGDPVSHSLSPIMHRAALEALGRPERYVAIRVESIDVIDALDKLAEAGYRGVNVTIPHKVTAAQWATSPDSFVQRVKVANTLRFQDRSAINTDAPGFLDTLKLLQIEPPAKILILGAGGSTQSILPALVDSGFQVSLWNRNMAKAERLVQEIGLQVPVVPIADPSECQLMINATSASLAGEMLPIAWDKAPTDLVAYDLMYGVQPTVFLQTAQARGLKPVSGLALLVAQGARSLEYWIGERVSRQVMHDAAVASVRRESQPL
jgi:shikimate dehydrogenase